jgi:HlyD family secretion protein
MGSSIATVGARLHAHRNQAIIVLAVLLIALAAVGAFVLRRPAGQAASVVANGSVEATEIVLSAKVPGRLSSVMVDEGETARTGMTLARIESDDVRAQAQAANAQVMAASAQVVAALTNVTDLQRQSLEASLAQSYASATTTSSIAQAVEAVTAAQHGVHAASAAFEKARSDLSRMTPLYRGGDIAAMQYDAYKAAYENASAQRDQAREALAQAQAAAAAAQAGTYQVAIRGQDVGTAGDRIRAGQAALAVARAELRAAVARRAEVAAEQADTIVRAPSDGTVLRVIAHGGEVVAAGAPILTMADLHKLYLRVYVSELDVARIRVGDRATVTVDAYPNQRLTGRVASVDQSAQFTPKTVHMPDERTRLVYGVRIALDDTQGFLKPGMVADARLSLRQPIP